MVEEPEYVFMSNFARDTTLGTALLIGSKKVNNTILPKENYCLLKTPRMLDLT